MRSRCRAGARPAPRRSAAPARRAPGAPSARSRRATAPRPASARRPRTWRRGWTARRRQPGRRGGTPAAASRRRSAAPAAPTAPGPPASCRNPPGRECGPRTGPRAGRSPPVAQPGQPGAASPVAIRAASKPQSRDDRLHLAVGGTVRVGERGDLEPPPGEDVPARAGLAAGLGRGGGDQVEVGDRMGADLVAVPGEAVQFRQGHVVRGADRAGDDEEGPGDAVAVHRLGGRELAGGPVVEGEGDHRRVRRGGGGVAVAGVAAAAGLVAAAWAGAGNQASTVMSSAVSAPKAARAGTARCARRSGSPRAWSSRPPSAASLWLRHDTRRAARAGVGQPGEWRYAFRTTRAGEAGHGRLWFNAAHDGPR